MDMKQLSEGLRQCRRRFVAAGSLGLAVTGILATGPAGGEAAPATAVERAYALSGTLTRLSGMTLSIRTHAGTQTAVITSSTRITDVRPATSNDLPVGECALATIREVRGGALDASNVTVFKGKAPKNPSGCKQVVDEVPQIGVPLFALGGGGSSATGSSGGSGGQEAPTGLSIAFGAIRSRSASHLDLEGWSLPLSSYLLDFSQSTTSSATPVDVTVGSSTTLREDSPASKAALRAGRCVTVIGSLGSDGTMTAKEVTVGSPGSHGCLRSARRR